MKKRVAFAIAILLNLIFITLAASSSPGNYDYPVLKGEFFVLMGAEGPLDLEIKNKDEALKQLLKEAQYVFSAMIYGLKFSYIPQDNARGVSDEFTVTPVYLIPWGDPSLSADAGTFNNEQGRYDAMLKYQVREEQMHRLESWQSSILITTGGTGEGSLYSGFEGKIEAINNSIKESVRNYLRPRIFNKPRKITGIAQIVDVPHITMSSGKYYCHAKITLRIDKIQEYKHY